MSSVLQQRPTSQYTLNGSEDEKENSLKLSENFPSRVEGKNDIPIENRYKEQTVIFIKRESERARVLFHFMLECNKR